MRSLPYISMQFRDYLEHDVDKRSLRFFCLLEAIFIQSTDLVSVDSKPKLLGCTNNEKLAPTMVCH